MSSMPLIILKTCIMSPLSLICHKEGKCAGVCSITIEQDCATCICDSSQSSRQQQCGFGHGTNNSKRKVFVHEKRICSVLCVSYENLAEPNEVVTKNKYGNTDSTNNSLAHPEEMLMMKPYKLQLV